MKTKWGLMFLCCIAMVLISKQNVHAEATIEITSHSNGDVISSSTTMVQGTYTDVEDMVLIVDGGRTHEVIEDKAEGTWSYELDTSLLEGDIELIVKGTNLETSYSAWSSPVTIAVDNPIVDTPKVTILNPKEGEALTNQTSVSVSVSGKHTLDKVDVRINGGKWIRAKQTGIRYTVNFYPNIDDVSSYSIEARATDNKGNIGFSQTTYVHDSMVLPTPEPLLNQDRAMWIWEKASYNLLYNDGSRELLKAFANDTSTFQQDRITTLYLGIDQYEGVDMVEEERERVRNLISWAHNEGFQVHALIAGGTKPPHFGAFERYHPVAIKELESILNYNLSSSQSERFDGVNVDIEPYIAPEFKQDKPSLQLQYLDLLQQMMDRKQAAHSNLAIGAAIPNWYDTSTHASSITWGRNGETEQTKWLSEHVQDVLDYISIMDYRDVAEGSAGIIERARGEIQYAEGIGKPHSVVLGVETKDIADGGDPETITFREEGRTYMEEQLDLVNTAYLESSSYGGIALHHYDTIRDLPSEWSPNGFYWTPPEDNEPPTSLLEEPTANTIDYESISLSYGRAFDNYEIDYYEIHRGLSQGFAPTEDTLAGEARGLSFHDSGLQSDTEYVYKVIPVDVSGNKGPESSEATAHTDATTLQSLIIKDSSIVYDDDKVKVTFTIIDGETGSPVEATMRGRFEYRSGKVVTGKTDATGTVSFVSESIPTESGTVGFKVNTIRKDGYYWEKPLPSLWRLETSWEKQRYLPTDDAFVRSDSYAKNNYGSESFLEIKTVAEGIKNYNRKAWMQFMPEERGSEVNQATLSFYVDRDVRDATVQGVDIDVVGANTLPWNEDSITWENQPTSTLKRIGTVTITKPGWYSIDVTDLMKEQQGETVSFSLTDPNRTDRLVLLHSKEHENAPILSIQ
ncbi:fibronectin [Pontibacillus halophilus JSM 076056 = DSM 19796]|uniref:Fibronectin n=1 Tax=Pontibacillus halophilus JSM 076056 = DSM 19796 TaxID=1385510 RepID=A0A0A5GFM3_9BACI|nr:DNRLRE domain-containing protein [Pontibacillus halophilus]KGX92011.1 fibronectin [Pontibacillus halophilus JSM 076056 = DSM 19796]